jgi:hypothetical protein
MITIPIFSFQAPPTRIFLAAHLAAIAAGGGGSNRNQREKLGQSFGLFGSFWVRFLIFQLLLGVPAQRNPVEALFSSSTFLPYGLSPLLLHLRIEA